MLEQMAKHSIVPSFTSQDIFTAPTYTLEYDVDSRQYALTLTDTNQTGIDLEAMSETAGISVSRNGNSYTFTTSNIINNPVCIQYEKKFSFHGAPMLIWGSPGHQTMATGAEDPVRFYAQFKTESTGSLEIIKSGDDDVSVAGWQFNISGNGIDMNVTVGEDGVIMVPDLTAGLNIP